MDSQLINRYLIAFYKVFFLVLGTIGNSLFIHLIIKKKQLRSRTSILQCVQSALHMVCQVGTLMTGVFDMGATYTRKNCFYRIAFYIFCQSAQGLIMLVIVLDILIFVKYPVIYRSLSLPKYILLTGLPILSFSTFYVLLANFTTTDETVFSCTPPFAFSITASMVYNQTFIVLSIIVLICYVILIRTFYVRSQSQSNYRSSLKTVKRLQVTVIIFIFTWFSSQLMAFVVLVSPSFSKIGGLLLSNLMIFVCGSYSNTFYVTMWKSKEYRDQFYSVWWKTRVSKAPSIASVTLKVGNSESMFQRRSPTQIN